ncbi:MAG: ferric reductase-like transmembrane domain-containing protein [Rhodocyclales bacterium]|nr:ferric reductase-like transmembrane domain-containing protein [Rhodocyclales bacterium]
MTAPLAGLLALVTLAWGWDVLTGGAAGGALPWALRQEALHLTGLYAIALMSLAMMLATRPAWLERPLGGMDRVYRLHRRAGILAVAAAAAHWLIEMADDVVKAWVGREGRAPKEAYDGLLEALRKLAEDMGEWALYGVLAMLALTLWRRFSYRRWRHLHQAMPLLYLMLAFHAALLAPPDYWRQPVGVLLALLLAGGTLAGAVALAGRIGAARRAHGTIASIASPAADVAEVTCRLDARWQGHRPGQFAFVSFDAEEGAHPFTIASADRGDRRVTFQIKALGDYTRGLAQRLRPGQAVHVEGPYGRFDLARRNPDAQQIWIAGGIGITPFLAWLESLQDRPQQAPAADLHYCTRDRAGDAFVPRLAALCAALPRLRLYVHSAQSGEFLTAAALAAAGDDARPADVWFCGPQGLADSLREGLQRAWRGRLRFHQEAFAMR